MKAALCLPGALLFAASVAQAGSLVPIGGGLDPDNRAIHEKIIELAGDDPLICVFGTASSKAEQKGAAAVERFRGYGAEARYVDITEANFEISNRDPQVIEQIGSCSGFFFIGGDQSRITKAIRDSPAHDALMARFEAGAVVAGSSAGAAMMSEIMISGGKSIDSLAGGDDPVETELGLGFVGGLVIDQHFLAYGRLGRLLRVTAESGTPLGVGVDENTAIVIPDSGPWEVIGESSVAILEVPVGTAPDAIEEVKLSLLSNRDRFDPASGRITIHPGRENTAEAGYYYEGGLISTTDIFGRDAVYDLVTRLVDSPEREAVGFAFRGSLDWEFDSGGLRLRFAKGEETAGYWGKKAGGARYAVVRVTLSVEPVKVGVKTK